MGRKQHVVNLSDEERRTLEWFISTGEYKEEDITCARVLLKADEGLTDSKICEKSVSTSVVLLRLPTAHAKTTASEGSRKLLSSSACMRIKAI